MLFVPRILLVFTLTHTHMIVIIPIHKSHVTFTAERTRMIKTLTIFTQIWIVGALINILATVAVSLKASVTCALNK